jgi:putative Holliday junction resolvase
MTRLLGIDLGTRRIGLAVGDSATGASRALATLRREDPAADAKRIGRVVSEQQVEEIVVGLPLNMDGTEGSQAIETRAWADAVGPLIGVPLRWRDERLTSVAAEAALGRQPRGRSGGPPSGAARTRRRATVDRDAARILVDAELRDRADVPRRADLSDRARLPNPAESRE